MCEALFVAKGEWPHVTTKTLGKCFAQQLVLEAIYVVTKENEARDDEDVESGAANPLIG